MKFLLALMFMLSIGLAQAQADSFKIKYFGAPWCPHCVIAKPGVELFEALHKNIEVEIVNVDDWEKSKRKQLTISNDLYGVPNYFFFVNGVRIARVVGRLSYKQLKHVADKYLFKKHNKNCRKFDQNPRIVKEYRLGEHKL